MRLVTWNVNSLGARMPRVLELLAEVRPDVVALQETKCASAAFPHLELLAEGYTAVEHSAGRWAGVALLVRDGLEVSDAGRGLAGEVAPDEARYVEATIDGITVASVYVVNGRSPDDPMFAAKLAFLDALGARARQLASRGPALIVGDFNVAPTDRDVWDPAAFVGGTHVTDEERTRVEAVLGAGFVDAYRHLEPDEPGFTWWDYRAGAFHRGLGMRLDLLLATEDLARKLTRCVPLRAYRKGPKPSDHAPVLLEWGDGPRLASGA